MYRSEPHLPLPESKLKSSPSTSSPVNPPYSFHPSPAHVNVCAHLGKALPGSEHGSQCHVLTSRSAPFERTRPSDPRPPVMRILRPLMMVAECISRGEGARPEVVGCCHVAVSARVTKLVAETSALTNRPAGLESVTRLNLSRLTYSPGLQAQDLALRHPESYVLQNCERDSLCSHLLVRGCYDQLVENGKSILALPPVERRPIRRAYRLKKDGRLNLRRLARRDTVKPKRLKED